MSPFPANGPAMVRTDRKDLNSNKAKNPGASPNSSNIRHLSPAIIVICRVSPVTHHPLHVTETARPRPSVTYDADLSAVNVTVHVGTHHRQKVLVSDGRTSDQ